MLGTCELQIVGFGLLAQSTVLRVQTILQEDRPSLLQELQKARAARENLIERPIVPSPGGSQQMDQPLIQ